MYAHQRGHTTTGPISACARAHRVQIRPRVHTGTGKYTPDRDDRASESRNVFNAYLSGQPTHPPIVDRVGEVFITQINQQKVERTHGPTL